MFKSIKATNFLSWSDLQIDFESGVTLIEGWNYDDQNPEGSGKSAIPNALVWAIYGKLPKDANINDVIKEGEKSCNVRVQLQNGACIDRSRKPNDLYIRYTNANRDDTIRGKDARETQQMIEELIGFSFETFCQTIYFAQNYPKKFITATEEEKAKILSELQELEVFDKAKKIAHEKLKETSTILNELSIELKFLEAERVNNFELISNMKELKEQNIQNFKIKKQVIDKNISKFENQIKQISKEIIVLEKSMNAKYNKDSIKKELESFIKERVELKLKIDHIEKEQRNKRKLTLNLENINKKLTKLDREISSIEKVKSPICPTCGGSFENKNKLKEYLKAIEKEFQEFKNEGNDITEQLKEFKNINKSKLEKILDNLCTEEAELRSSLKKIEKKELSIQSLKNDLQKLEGRLEATLDEYEDLEIPDNSSLDNKIITKKIKVEKIENKIKKYLKEINELKDYSSRLSVLKDSFKAVKSYVFQTILHDLTLRSNKYLSNLFNQEVKIKFLNTGTNGEVSKIIVLVTIDGNERPLGLYSGGQSRRIQLAVDLALSDILSSRAYKPVNFRILDEIFKDLSEDSMENILSLLEGLQGTTLLIEHNSLFKNIVNNSVRIELRNGTSKMVESNYGTQTLEMPKMQNGI